MRGLKIYLANGTYDGTITMSSDTSKISVIRVERNNIRDYETELDGPGVYLLLMGKDEVYVGQTGFDTIKNRILNTHSRDIDSSWHSVLAFKFDCPVVANELVYIENSMCEYAHTHFAGCLTLTPAKVNCNAKYRKSHYGLTGIQIHSCENYIKDMEYYISMFPGGIFAKREMMDLPVSEASGFGSTALLHLRGRKVAATGFIAGTKFVVCKGAEFSRSETNSCPTGVRKHRKKLLNDGKIVNGKYAENVSFDSPSTAAAVTLGASANGNIEWVYSDGQCLKQKG